MGLIGNHAKPEDGTDKSSSVLGLGSLARPPKIDLKSQVRHRTAEWYRKYIVEGVLRQKPLKPSKDGRHVPLRVESRTQLIDERRGHEYIPNTIRTSRYTVYDFVPKQLFFQFTRLANFYFLCVGIPQAIPGLSTTGNYTTILPLLFFVLLTIIKEGYDDYKRHRLDKLENAYAATVLGKRQSPASEASSTRRWYDLRPTTATVPILDRREEPQDDWNDEYSWNSVQWKDIRVGDLVKLSRDDDVPADLVLLNSTGENGVAYVDTMALDGETSLKIKESIPALREYNTISSLQTCDAEFVLEDPNANLYGFEGKVSIHGKTVPITLNEVIYRGSTLRNTQSMVGIVINTGDECKIRMNANQHPAAKKPAIEKIMNKIVITLAVYVIILSGGCSVGYLIWKRSTESSAWYLTDASVGFKEIIIGFAIQFNNVIPLSLYVSLEIVKLGQMMMVNSDAEMYDEATDTPARCNTNTILENLGQVSHIFSDKTGTLTENVMKFRKISVAGTSWLHEMDLAAPAEAPEPMAEASPHGVGLQKTTDMTNVITSEVELPITSPISIRVTSPTSADRPSYHGRRSSSHWASTGRPDHSQPELTTTDLLDFIRERPASPFARKARDYILALALCHTCLPEEHDGKLDFQAASPDELALVRAAQDLGYLVASRSTQTVTLKINSNGDTPRTEVYEILDVIEFSSKRKRMSIIVRYPDGRICLICKGADSMILPRLRLSNLALKKAGEIRKSAEIEHEMRRRSEQMEPRNSFGGRPSLTIVRRSLGAQGPPSPSASRSRSRPAIERSQSAEASKRWSEDRGRPSLGTRNKSFDVSKRLSMPPTSPGALSPADDKFTFLDHPSINDDSMVFTRCFKHLDEFASEGLRTLCFAKKFISEPEYSMWKKIYNDASTSLIDRQEMIEAAGELIEQSLELLGASAIEDKLQNGVPETIDKLRRANIKIWMLTGDKRETAINIAHSARICQPGSDIFILDSSKGGLESQILAIAEDIQSGCVHSVVVIDGHTLAVAEQSPELKLLFYNLIPTIDSVICCRASPAQKSSIVKAIRHRVPGALTLAIGDGANDLAMISAAHVGVGISGKEGLQAARVADYAIAQFRFLQRLLLVHGRWNYIRTAKFVLATFWKELFFYLPTAMYQRYNGYTGTSLYESWNLTVLNVLFTSLCTIVPGMWEQDLSAQTLLAVPELYVYGQRDKGLNVPKYLWWMFTAAVEGIGVWFVVWAGYGAVFGMVDDNGLFALGQLAFSVAIVWTNWKLFIIETHHKTALVLGSLMVTITGWWAWNAFMAGIYVRSASPYAVRDGLTQTFGPDGLWWLTLIAAVVMLIAFEIALKAAKRSLIKVGLWSLPLSWKAWSMGQGKKGLKAEEVAEEMHLEVWQELEQDPVVRERLRRINEEDHGDGPENPADVGEVEAGVMELREVDLERGRRYGD